MPWRTTSCAPPEVAPATILIALPSLLANALIAGFGPRYAASRLPPNNASTAAGPASKICGSSFVLPSCLAMKPRLTPMIAAAWVTLAK
jgi:hypothetical protein